MAEDRELDGVDLDLAGRELGVLVGAAALHDTADADDPLAAQGARDVVGAARRLAVAGKLGIEDDLGDSLTIAQVDEDAAAMISVDRDPPEENDRLALVARPQLGVVVGAFQLVDESGHGGSRCIDRFRRLPQAAQSE